MASNYMGVGAKDKCRRWDKKGKGYIYVSRPQVINNYNSNMGGVDKMDFLITLYRTFIRSKKWTLRMFAHAIDMACVNGWLEYKEKAANMGVAKNDVLDLLHFRAYVAEVLILAGKTSTRKRGRPAADSPGPSTPKPLKVRPEIRPVAEVQLDRLDHLPSIDEKDFASRYKVPGCKGRSRILCQICNVHLCLTKKSNCFAIYHTK
ncbi:piggyBac transposable element-derived protein 3-like [Anthonomus grandis grandis]|uniref:piggyBac transposable element-derived protein 3-like n=1 Tax=Anthonomus grandis grandis TaxID=2921223 RepID=UPI0021650F66|nr:piggyBac transposable element-derived protein 3-like [Anthonomus grandis grandis]